MMQDHKIIERMITRKAQPKADELGIEFKVKFSVKEGMNNFLVRIKRNIPNSLEGLSEEEIQGYKRIAEKQSQFVDHIAKIIVPDYSYDVRFTYPSRL